MRLTVVTQEPDNKIITNLMQFDGGLPSSGDRIYVEKNEEVYRVLYLKWDETSTDAAPVVVVSKIDSRQERKK